MSGFLLLESGGPLLLENGTTALALEPATTSTFLAATFGPIPAALNLAPWTSTAAYTDFNWVDSASNNRPNGFTQDGLSVGASTTAPDLTVTGQHLTESATSGFHRVYSFFGSQMHSNPNITFRVIAIAKAAERTRIVLTSEVFIHETVIGASVGYDLAGGNVGYDVVAGSSTNVLSQTMTSLGDGWWACQFDMKYTGGYSISNWVWQPKIYLDNGSGTAARSINYVGDGTSGVYAWWLNMLPAAAWPLTTQSYYTTFTSLSGFDLSNTVTAGFDWYINNAAPNSLNQTWWSTVALPPSLSSNFTISSPDTLQLYDPNNNAGKWTTMTYTVGFPNAGGYVGQAWQAPMVIDGLFQWDTSLSSSLNFGGLGPAFWGHQVEAMAGTMNPSKHWMEWDITDIGGTTGAVSDLYLDGTNTPITTGINPFGSSFSIGPTEWHRISGLWLSMASNGYGQGLLMTFLDGGFLHHSDFVYNACDAPQPPLSLPNGWNSQAEWQHMPIMMDTGNNVTANPGGGWPMRVQYVQVYTHPTPPKIYDYWNIFDQLGDLTIANNGLQITKTSAGTVWEAIRASFGKSSGKWYWEITLSGTVNSATSLMLGIMSEAASVASGAFPGSSAQGAGARHGSNWNSFVSGVTGGFAGAVAFANADVFGFAFDAGSGVIWVHRNGSWINGTPGSGSNIWSGLTGHTWYPASAIHDASVSTISANFGSSAFAFSLPSGYLGLAAN